MRRISAKPPRPCAFDREVDDGYVGAMLSEQAETVHDIIGDEYRRNAGILEHAAAALQHDRVIVDDEDRGHADLRLVRLGRRFGGSCRQLQPHRYRNFYANPGADTRPTFDGKIAAQRLYAFPHPAQCRSPRGRRQRSRNRHRVFPARAARRPGAEPPFPHPASAMFTLIAAAPEWRIALVRLS